MNNTTGAAEVELKNTSAASEMSEQGQVEEQRTGIPPQVMSTALKHEVLLCHRCDASPPPCVSRLDRRRSCVRVDSIVELENVACVMFKPRLFTLNEVKPRSHSNERVSLQNVFDVLDRVIWRSTRGAHE